MHFFTCLLICVVCTIQLCQVSAGSYDYKLALKDSILFYAAQRSGKLPANNPIPWRGDSGMNDKGQAGQDLTGGWYDAGDLVKFGFPMAWSTTTLLWGLLLYKDAYEAAGQLEAMYESVRTPLDYFIKCHTQDNEFYAQCGNGDIDHATWTKPECMKEARPCYKVTQSKPGSDVVGETAAALAAGSLVFKSKDPNYSAKLLQHAKQLFDFANKHQGNYNVAIPESRNFYTSSGYKDELAWGAAWLYKATKDKSYVGVVTKYYQTGPAWSFSWDAKQAGYQTLMYCETKDKKYSTDVEAFMKSWSKAGGMKYTPKGMAYRDDWGPLRYTASTSFIALAAADCGIGSASTYRAFAKSQINYILGDVGHSFVVGFGNNPPQRPHHRASSCRGGPTQCNCGWNCLNSPAPSPHVLTGALVGGPDDNDNYVDKRSDYQKNEVACDYNAGYQSALAGLIHLKTRGQFPDD